MEGSDFLLAGVLFLFAAVAGGAAGIAAGDWRCVGIFAGRDCYWPVGAGFY